MNSRLHVPTRKGAVIVEFAIVLPLVVLLFFGTLEFGRALNVKHTLQESARAACRMAVLQGSTNEDVNALAAASLTAANIDPYTLVVTPTDFQSTEEGDPITVTISSPFAEVSWFRPFYVNKDISASCTMRAMRRPPGDYPEATPADKKKANKKVAKKVAKKDAKKTNKKQESLSWKKN